ncbi:hypothetical protein [Candidatus Oleimmundimicrobium sp.]|uniref:hypothetical protein n=1 Tax=Candidatus Oleimmundimicrobium sp. TaxID=3060597 RepID=UPI00280B6642|nr:hypothetical protein [Candidatus Oleimmundimicrobium sp.]
MNFPTFKISLDISVLIVLLSFVLVSSIFLPEVIFDLLSYAQPISISEYFCEPVILAGGVIEPGANPLYKVGDKKTFYARRFTTGVEGEEYALSAACRAVGQFCYVFVEEGQKVDDFWINNLKAEFDEKISHKEKIRNRFELTFENEGRVVLLLLDVKDEWKPQKREERYIAGYFWAENQLPGFRSQTGNEMELLYLDINPANLTTADFLETVSHEYEHLINWSFAEIRIWLIIFFQTGFISFFVLNYFLGRKWKGKL